MLIELVMRLQGRVDIEMLQQHAAGACVFRQNQINRFQRLNRTESHVLQIADRCGNEVKHLSETAVKGNDKLLVTITLGVPLEMGSDISHRLIEGMKFVDFREGA